ncbi:MAG: MarR family transcriptional regulator [Hyphomicrobiales bacterium]|nr:MarR family transcriptional regulator [Hyphomicrobiales bacterium]MCP4997541.1 MarR family transcriptional regulator [Hyphomicrobiales bacterium]
MYPTKEETRLWVALNLSQRKIYREMDTALKTEGLPPLRWYDVLWELERATCGGLRPYEMGQKLNFEQSNLSRLLQRLVCEGLVEEFVYPDDGRGKVLQITARGREVRKQMWKIYGSLIHKHISKVSDQDDMATAVSALNLLIG